MAPIKWFKVEDTPTDLMWTDHKFWYPMILKQIQFKAYFKYLNDETMLDRNIQLLDSPGKTKQSWINVVIKRDTQILCSKVNQSWNYLGNFHDQVRKGESTEGAAKRLALMLNDIVEVY